MWPFPNQAKSRFMEKMANSSMSKWITESTVIFFFCLSVCLLQELESYATHFFSWSCEFLLSFLSSLSGWLSICLLVLLSMCLSVFIICMSGCMVDCPPFLLFYSVTACLPIFLISRYIWLAAGWLAHWLDGWLSIFLFCFTQCLSVYRIFLSISLAG